MAIPRPSKPSAYTDRIPPLLLAFIKVEYGDGPFDRSDISISERATQIDRAHSRYIGLSTAALAEGEEIIFTYYAGAKRVPVRVGWTVVNYNSTATPAFTYSNGGPSDLFNDLTFAAQIIPDPPVDPEEPYVYDYKDTFILWRKAH